jgi:Zn-finger protein
LAEKGAEGGMTSKLQQRIETVENGALAKGKKELLAHLYDERLTARQAIAAKCYDCMGYFADGRQDCKMPHCPLYPWMAYRDGGPRKSRVMSAEQRKAISDRAKNGVFRRSDKPSVTITETKSKKVSKHG